MKRPWDEVFGIVREAATTDLVQGLYRVKARNASPAELTELLTARAEAFAVLGHPLLTALETAD